jgi:hypothetical protein
MSMGTRYALAALLCLILAAAVGGSFALSEWAVSRYRMIQFRKPASLLEARLSEGGRRITITGARLENGMVYYSVEMDGQPRQFPEPEDACLRSFWVTGVTLTHVQLDPDGTLVYTVKEL